MAVTETPSPREQEDPTERMREMIAAFEEARDRLLIDQARASEEASQELEPLIAALHEGVQELTEEIARRRQTELERVNQEQAQELVERSRRLQDEIVMRQKGAIEVEVATELNRVVLEVALAALVRASKDGSIRQANPEAMRLLALSYDREDEGFGGDWEASLVLEDGSPCPEDENPLRQCLRTGEPRPASTFGLRRADGTLSWAVFRAAPLFEPRSREVRGAVLSAVDVTERKRLEEMLRRS